MNESKRYIYWTDGSLVTRDTFTGPELLAVLKRRGFLEGELDAINNWFNSLHNPGDVRVKMISGLMVMQVGNMS